MMKLIKYPSKEQWAELLKRPALNTESVRYSSYYYK